MPADRDEDAARIPVIKKEDWLLLQSGPGAPAFNMAVDEALLESMRRLARPVLRFYSWTERAASFGYFQKYTEVQRVTLLRPLVRRPTGGGVVPHDADWTYSLIFPAGHEWYDLTATESYRRVHEWLQAAFARVALTTELAPCARKTQDGQCFVGHEKFDLVWRGQKIAGAAQRRTRNGLLIQGSVQAPGQLAKVDWQKAMCDVAHFQQGVDWVEFRLDAELVWRVGDLEAGKYLLERYNQKR